LRTEAQLLLGEQKTEDRGQMTPY